eukprot:TRINITY_DN50853_c0_g1_i1.p2 TRINITY_DN50853_c0_g1~~TRINITY_DN50853_c0_g1_i1.p2  ORF type:complete len:133 (-),score=37.86 TRINITY_DN50853_c0_g1_i1:23-421(-)
MCIRDSVTIDQVVELLLQPLHPCDRCNDEWDQEASTNLSRTTNIRKYVGGGLRLHPELFDGKWRGEWLVPGLRQALESGELAGMMTQETEGVYSFPFLEASFCEMLLEECDHYSACLLYTSDAADEEDSVIV